MQPFSRTELPIKEALLTVVLIVRENRTRRLRRHHRTIPLSLLIGDRPLKAGCRGFAPFRWLSSGRLTRTRTPLGSSRGRRIVGLLPRNAGHGIIASRWGCYRDADLTEAICQNAVLAGFCEWPTIQPVLRPSIRARRARRKYPIPIFALHLRRRRSRPRRRKP